MKRKYHLMAFLGLLWLASACQSKDQVDLMIYNAKVYTVDAAFSEQQAFAVKNGKFVAVGTNEDIRGKYQAKETIDLQGQAVYPGFYDAHAHFWGYAETLGQVDLVGADSFEEILERLKAFRAEMPEAQWIVGRGWDQNRWPGQAFPDRTLLDAVFPDVPVYLVRVDGHAAVANSKALALAGINQALPVEGGSIETKNGRLTGILIDNAMNKVVDVIPPLTSAERIALLQKAEAACLAVGLTTVSDAGLDRWQIEFLDSLYKASALNIRNHAMITISPENMEHYLAAGPYVSDKLTAHTFKILADGALGSRGACMLEPYSDAPTQGFLLYSPETIREALRKIKESPFQVSTHAIGDSTNRFILKAYAEQLQGPNDRRWRLEHAQILAPGDQKYFSAHSIIPSVQPTHATSDMYWAEQRIGAERMKGAYAFKHLLDETGLLALGSDFPVEHINPLYGFHAAVARVDAKGYPEGGFQMDQAISREAAMKGMTIWSAYTNFEEKTRGSIEVGKAADFVVLEKDLMVVPFAELRDAKVLRTYIGGHLLYLADR
jgi:predicted amidohydrolase YtcJ